MLKRKFLKKLFSILIVEFFITAQLHAFFLYPEEDEEDLLPEINPSGDNFSIYPGIQSPQDIFSREEIFEMINPPIEQDFLNAFSLVAPLVLEYYSDYGDIAGYPRGSPKVFISTYEWGLKTGKVTFQLQGVEGYYGYLKFPEEILKEGEIIQVNLDELEQWISEQEVEPVGGGMFIYLPDRNEYLAMKYLKMDPHSIAMNDKCKDGTLLLTFILDGSSFTPEDQESLKEILSSDVGAGMEHVEEWLQNFQERFKDKIKYLITKLNVKRQPSSPVEFSGTNFDEVTVSYVQNFVENSAYRREIWSGSNGEEESFLIINKVPIYDDGPDLYLEFWGSVLNLYHYDQGQKELYPIIGGGTVLGTVLADNYLLIKQRNDGRSLEVKKYVLLPSDEGLGAWVGSVSGEYVPVCISESTITRNFDIPQDLSPGEIYQPSDGYIEIVNRVYYVKDDEENWYKLDVPSVSKLEYKDLNVEITEDGYRYTKFTLDTFLPEESSLQDLLVSLSLDQTFANPSQEGDVLRLSVSLFSEGREMFDSDISLGLSFTSMPSELGYQHQNTYKYEIQYDEEGRVQQYRIYDSNANTSEEVAYVYTEDGIEIFADRYQGCFENPEDLQKMDFVRLSIKDMDNPQGGRDRIVTKIWGEYLEGGGESIEGKSVTTYFDYTGVGPWVSHSWETKIFSYDEGGTEHLERVERVRNYFRNAYRNLHFRQVVLYDAEGGVKQNRGALIYNDMEYEFFTTFDLPESANILDSDFGEELSIRYLVKKSVDTPDYQTIYFKEIQKVNMSFNYSELGTALKDLAEQDHYLARLVPVEGAEGMVYLELLFSSEDPAQPAEIKIGLQIVPEDWVDNPLLPLLLLGSLYEESPSMEQPLYIEMIEGDPRMFEKIYSMLKEDVAQPLRLGLTLKEEDEESPAILLQPNHQHRFRRIFINPSLLEESGVEFVPPEQWTFDGFKQAVEEYLNRVREKSLALQRELEELDLQDPDYADKKEAIEREISILRGDDLRAFVAELSEKKELSFEDIYGIFSFLEKAAPPSYEVYLECMTSDDSISYLNLELAGPNGEKAFISRNIYDKEDQQPYMVNEIWFPLRKEEIEKLRLYSSIAFLEDFAKSMVEVYEANEVSAPLLDVKMGDNWFEIDISNFITMLRETGIATDPASRVSGEFFNFWTAFVNSAIAEMRLNGYMKVDSLEEVERRGMYYVEFAEDLFDSEGRPVPIKIKVAPAGLSLSQSMNLGSLQKITLLGKGVMKREILPVNWYFDHVGITSTTDVETIRRIFRERKYPVNITYITKNYSYQTGRGLLAEKEIELAFDPLGYLQTVNMSYKEKHEGLSVGRIWSPEDFVNFRKQVLVIERNENSRVEDWEALFSRYDDPIPQAPGGIDEYRPGYDPENDYVEWRFTRGDGSLIIEGRKSPTCFNSRVIPHLLTKYWDFFNGTRPIVGEIFEVRGPEMDYPLLEEYKFICDETSGKEGILGIARDPEGRIQAVVIAYPIGRKMDQYVFEYEYDEDNNIFIKSITLDLTSPENFYPQRVKFKFPQGALAIGDWDHFIQYDPQGRPLYVNLGLLPLPFASSRQVDFMEWLNMIDRWTDEDDFDLEEEFRREFVGDVSGEDRDWITVSWVDTPFVTLYTPYAPFRPSEGYSIKPEDREELIRNFQDSYDKFRKAIEIIASGMKTENGYTVNGVFIPADIRADVALFDEDYARVLQYIWALTNVFELANGFYSHSQIKKTYAGFLGVLDGLGASIVEKVAWVLSGIENIINELQNWGEQPVVEWDRSRVYLLRPVSYQLYGKYWDTQLGKEFLPDPEDDVACENWFRAYGRQMGLLEGDINLLKTAYQTLGPRKFYSLIAGDIETWERFVGDLDHFEDWLSNYYSPQEMAILGDVDVHNFINRFTYLTPESSSGISVVEPGILGLDINVWSIKRGHLVVAGLIVLELLLSHFVVPAIYAKLARVAEAAKAVEFADALQKGTQLLEEASSAGPLRRFALRAMADGIRARVSMEAGRLALRSLSLKERILLGIQQWIDMQVKFIPINYGIMTAQYMISNRTFQFPSLKAWWDSLPGQVPANAIYSLIFLGAMQPGSVLGSWVRGMLKAGWEKATFPVRSLGRYISSRWGGSLAISRASLSKILPPSLVSGYNRASSLLSNANLFARGLLDTIFGYEVPPHQPRNLFNVWKSLVMIEGLHEEVNVPLMGENFCYFWGNVLDSEFSRALIRTQHSRDLLGNIAEFILPTPKVYFTLLTFTAANFIREYIFGTRRYHPINYDVEK